MRIELPIVIDTEEKKVAELIGQKPDRFECERAIFYSIDNVRPYMDYKNICMISSGGNDFIVGLSMDDVDDMIQISGGFLIGAN